MELTCGIGNFPYRMAIAGGWIDQPFVSRLNPCPPGSMVVVSLEPTVRFMDRSGMASGTRQVALRLWNGSLPKRNPAKLVRELYAAENIDKPEPSGSQDMIGLIYPGINRLDYDFAVEGEPEIRVELDRPDSEWRNIIVQTGCSRLHRGKNLIHVGSLKVP